MRTHLIYEGDSFPDIGVQYSGVFLVMCSIHSGKELIVFWYAEKFAINYYRRWKATNDT